ncbi:MAG: PP2C family serine/threonine-protein phosphatase [Bacteriovoracia bacterium]
MKQTIAFGVAAQQGNWPVQEDGYFVDPQERIFALADGFGGRGNGDIAAKMALRELRARLPRGEASKPASVASQRQLFLDINKIILEWNAKRPAAGRGGCSLALVQVGLTGLVTVTNCGGSVVGLVRNGACQALLSPQAAPRARPGGAILPEQALGLGADISPETRVFPSLRGDLVFLASSGFEWESAAFQGELLAQWGIHLPGSGMAPLAENLVRVVSPEWNATFLGLEIP